MGYRLYSMDTPKHNPDQIPTEPGEVVVPVDAAEPTTPVAEQATGSIVGDALKVMAGGAALALGLAGMHSRTEQNPYNWG